MKAIVVGLSPEQEEDLLWVENGQHIEIVGFVGGGSQLMAVWRDDEGRVYEIMAWAIRMLPNTDQADSVVVSDADYKAMVGAAP